MTAWLVRPETSGEKPHNLCMDAGYTGHQDEAKARHYIVHIHPHGEEKKDPEHYPGSRARRWVVDVVHSFMNRFRKLLVRYKKKAANYLALVQFACAIIVWRKLIPVHQQFRDKFLHLRFR